MAKKSKGSMEKVRQAQEMLNDHVRRKGLRKTRQRDQVLAVFLTSDAHKSVDELLTAVRAVDHTIGSATVYRCMNLFVEAGIAKVRRFNDGCTRFEPAVAVEHHDHAICTSCGVIKEFHDDEIERLQVEVASKLGFDVRSHRLELYGLCNKCKTASATRE